MCSTDPARLRDVVAESVRARANSWWTGGLLSSSAVTSLFPQPSAAVVRAAAPPRRVDATINTASAGSGGGGGEGEGGGGGGGGGAGVAAKVAAAAAAAAGMPGVGAAIEKGGAATTMEFPEDPEGAVADYVEQAMLRVPDEILGVILRNALFGPTAMLVVGALLLLLAEGGGGSSSGSSSSSSSSSSTTEKTTDGDDRGAPPSSGGGGDLMLVAGTLLVAFGAFGVLTAYVTHWLSRTMLRTVLHALVQQQVAAVRKTKAIFADLGEAVSSTFSNAFSSVYSSYGSAESAT